MTELSDLIKREFNKMAGKGIKLYSYVVRYRDKKIYQVIEKDSRLVKCKVVLNLFEEVEEKEIVFKKDEVCLYLDLFKKINQAKKEISPFVFKPLIEEK